MYAMQVGRRPGCLPEGCKDIVFDLFSFEDIKKGGEISKTSRHLEKLLQRMKEISHPFI